MIPESGFKVLLVGLGQIGCGYDIDTSDPNCIQTHARAFSLNPHFQLVGGVDSLPENQNRFKQRYGLPSFSSLSLALDKTRPSVVVLGIPTEQHEAGVSTAVECPSVRVLLCEKPLAYLPEQGQRMVQLCENRKIKLFVNYMRRSNPLSITLKNRLEMLSNPLKGVAWYTKGFLHNASHLFNLLQFWLGEPVGHQVLHLGRQVNAWDAEPDIEVQFGRGRFLFLAKWAEEYEDNSMEIHSPDGIIQYKHGGAEVTWLAANASVEVPFRKILTTSPELLPAGMTNYQGHVVEQLARELDDQTTTLCTGMQALTTLRAMYTILQETRK